MKTILITAFLLVACAAGADGVDFDTYRIVVDRNIFDPNRSPRRDDTPRDEAPRPEPQRAAESLALLGTLIDEATSPTQTIALFGGSMTHSGKIAEVGDTIGEFRIAAIDTDGVRVEGPDGPHDLPVGAALGRAARSNEWTVTTARPPEAAARPETDKSEDEPSDALQRMLARRKQEMEQ